MAIYVLRRLLWTVVLLLLVTTATFAVFNVLPTGDRATLLAGKNAGPDRIAELRTRFGTDEPKLEQ